MFHAPIRSCFFGVFAGSAIFAALLGMSGVASASPDADADQQNSIAPSNMPAARGIGDPNLSAVGIGDPNISAPRLVNNRLDPADQSTRGVIAIINSG